MKNKLLKILLVCSVLGLFVNFAMAEEASEESSNEPDITSGDYLNENNYLEQLDAAIPYLRAYTHLENELDENDRFYASAGNTELKYLSHKKWDKEKNGINYYLLVDVSGSVDKNQFKEIKKQMLAFADDLGPNDKVTLISVGVENQLLLDYKGVEDIEEIKNKINSLNTNEAKTYLYTAITDTIKNRINKKTSLPEVSDDETDKLFTGNRNVIIVVTDGADDTEEDGKTERAAMEALEKYCIPMYAVIEDYVGKDKTEKGEKIKTFAEDVEKSGGVAILYKKDEKCFENVIKKIQDVYIVDYKFKSAITEDKTISFGVVTDGVSHAFKDSKAFKKDYWKDRCMEDKTAPTVKEIKQSDKKTIEIIFSEPVENAANKNYYDIVFETTGKSIAISSIRYIDEENSKIEITAESDILKGKYKIGIKDGIKDVYGAYYKDTDENKLKATEIEKEFEGEEYVPPKESSGDTIIVNPTTEKETVVEKEKKSFFQKFWWLIIAIAVLIVAIALIIIYAVIKKNKGVVVIDDKVQFGNKVEQKTHIGVEKAVAQTAAPGVPISFYVSSGNMPAKTINANVNGSIIVGRSKTCDIFIDDTTISRQHFAIEAKNGEYYIQDLETTNGTFLNGVKVTNKRRLEKDDKIKIGNLNIVVRW